jgi:hypothetical protein
MAINLADNADELSASLRTATYLHICGETVKDYESAKELIAKALVLQSSTNERAWCHQLLMAAEMGLSAAPAHTGTCLSLLEIASALLQAPDLATGVRDELVRAIAYRYAKREEFSVAERRRAIS